MDNILHGGIDTQVAAVDSNSTAAGADDMAALVAQQPSNPTSRDANVAKGSRYRAAPAKTFQCRGYGDCRMVFSRSEHLARHVRYVYRRSYFFFRFRARRRVGRRP